MTKKAMVGVIILLLSGTVGMASAAKLSRIEHLGKVMYQDKIFH